MAGLALVSGRRFLQGAELIRRSQLIWIELGQNYEKTTKEENIMSSCISPKNNKINFINSTNLGLSTFTSSVPSITTNKFYILASKLSLVISDCMNSHNQIVDKNLYLK